MNRFKLLTFLSSGEKVSVDFDEEYQMNTFVESVVNNTFPDDWLRIQIPTGEILLKAKDIIGFKIENNILAPNLLRRKEHQNTP